MTTTIRYKGGQYIDYHSPEEIDDSVKLTLDGKGVIWKLKDPATKENRRWNSRYGGKLAFNTRGHYGYLTGRIQGQNYYAHRVIWCLHYGSWPEGFIDHIDGNRSNNDITNLRVVLKRDNNKNAALRADSKTGITGVTVKKGAKARPFIVNIKDFNGRQVFGGAFSSIEDAANRRKELEEMYGYHKNHGKVLNESFC